MHICRRWSLEVARTNQATRPRLQCLLQQKPPTSSMSSAGTTYNNCLFSSLTVCFWNCFESHIHQDQPSAAEWHCCTRHHTWPQNHLPPWCAWPYFQTKSLPKIFQTKSKFYPSITQEWWLKKTLTKSFRSLRKNLRMPSCCNDLLHSLNEGLHKVATQKVSLCLSLEDLVSTKADAHRLRAW